MRKPFFSFFLVDISRIFTYTKYEFKRAMKEKDATKQQQQQQIV